MNNSTIIGNCDSNGLFTAENPHVKKFSGFEYTNFENAHPPLFCYNENNQPVKEVEGVEVKLQHQYYSNAGVWINYEYSEDFYLTVQGYETRMIYISVHSTEKAEDICIICDEDISKKDFCADCGLNKSDERPLPEAQPLERVKKAEEILINIIGKVIGIDKRVAALYNFTEVKKIAEVYHAQFATDAGGGKGMLTFLEDRILDYITGSSADQDYNDGLKVALDEIHKLKTGVTTAHSTHSSSEMVEVWISVKDRLPDTSGQVYGCMHKTQDIYICHFKKSRNLFQVYGAGADPISDMKVTHWKPLDKPPMDVCREIDCNKPATKEEYPGNAFYLCDEHFDKYKNLI